MEAFSTVGIGRYVETFKENLIDGRVLPELTLSDLKEDLGVRELRNRKARP